MRDLRAAGLPVAMVIGAVGARDPDGIEVLAGIRAIDPTALRVAAVGWGDWQSVRLIFDAVTLGKIDHWVTLSGAGPGRGVPPLDYRVPEGVEQPARRRFRAGAGDWRAVVRAVSGAA
jgi:hypothetical protein